MPISSDSFDTLESAQEYVRLLTSQIELERACIQEDIANAVRSGSSRRLAAIQMVDYKLTQLSQHLNSAGRMLNDLRMLRRLLLGESELPPIPPAGKRQSKREESQEFIGV